MKIHMLLLATVFALTSCTSAEEPKLTPIKLNVDDVPAEYKTEWEEIEEEVESDPPVGKFIYYSVVNSGTAEFEFKYEMKTFKCSEEPYLCQIVVSHMPTGTFCRGGGPYSRNLDNKNPHPPLPPSPKLTGTINGEKIDRRFTYGCVSPTYDLLELSLESST